MTAKRLVSAAGVWLAFAAAACTSGQSDPTGTGHAGNGGNDRHRGDRPGGQSTAGSGHQRQRRVSGRRARWNSGAVGRSGRPDRSGAAPRPGRGHDRAGPPGPAGAAGSIGSAGTTGAGGRGGTTGAGGSRPAPVERRPATPFAFTSAPGATGKPERWRRSPAPPTDGHRQRPRPDVGRLRRRVQRDGLDAILQLSAAEQDQAIKLLFDATDGAGSLGPHPDRRQRLRDGPLHAERNGRRHHDERASRSRATR